MESTSHLAPGDETLTSATLAHPGDYCLHRGRQAVRAQQRPGGRLDLPVPSLVTTRHSLASQAQDHDRPRASRSKTRSLRLAVPASSVSKACTRWMHTVARRQRRQSRRRGPTWARIPLHRLPSITSGTGCVRATGIPTVLAAACMPMVAPARRTGAASPLIGGAPRRPSRGSWRTAAPQRPRKERPESLASRVLQGRACCQASLRSPLGGEPKQRRLGTYEAARYLPFKLRGSKPA